MRPTDAPGAGPRHAAPSGLTRRRFLGAVGAMGAAATGAPVLSMRAAYGAPGETGNTVISIVLRGGADGLRVLVPASAELGLPLLRTSRPGLLPDPNTMVSLAGARGWALNPAMAPLHDLLWKSGELALVPAAAAPNATRSHFQAEQCVERGGSERYSTGWLDRVLGELGSGAPFQGLAATRDVPPSMDGPHPKLVASSLDTLTFPAEPELIKASETALRRMYSDVGGVLATDVPAALSALSTVAKIRSGGGPQHGATYPDGALSKALRDIADVLHADVGLQVAALDIGGWDHHINEAPQFDRLLGELAGALAAFFTDLGPKRRSRVTVMVHSEFGRRVQQNASAGTDHGTGGLVMVAGGGLAGSGVRGQWRPLHAQTDLAGGDVPLVNNIFDVFAEVVTKRLGVRSIAKVFPDHVHRPLGIMA